jgi:hypothetical protein
MCVLIGAAASFHHEHGGSHNDNQHDHHGTCRDRDGDGIALFFAGGAENSSLLV